MPASLVDQLILVLAAGMGQRMGGPKALMTVAGRPWWQHQQDRLAQTGRDSLWVVSPIVAETFIAGPGSPPRLINADPAAPMFASIARGIESLAAGPTPPPRLLFILPVDVPCPTRDTFDRLAAAADQHGASIPAHGGKKGHPVCLSWPWISTNLRPHLAGTAPEALRLDRLLGPATAIVAVDDPAVTINLNSPEDVQRYRAAGC